VVEDTLILSVAEM